MTADAYAHCAALTRDQWAWEFLRRNPDYQARLPGASSRSGARSKPTTARRPIAIFQRWKRTRAPMARCRAKRHLLRPAANCAWEMTTACCSNAGWGRNGGSTNSRSTQLRLVSRAAELRRSGLSAPLSVASERARWERWLRLLDAQAANATLEAMEESGLCDDAKDCAQELGEALAMSRKGYLDILRLAS
jgi:hypothetical protein